MLLLLILSICCFLRNTENIDTKGKENPLVSLVSTFEKDIKTNLWKSYNICMIIVAMILSPLVLNFSAYTEIILLISKVNGI